MSIILGKIVSIFLITAIGYVANRKGILPDQANTYLVDLLMLITTPCMIVSSITSTELTEDTLLLTIGMLGCAALWFIISAFLAWIVCVKILRISGKKDAGIYMALMTSINNGFMGFPITFALFGNDCLYLMVMFQTLLMIYLYSGGILQVNYGLGGPGATANPEEEKSKFDLKATLKCLQNPSTICAAISIGLLLAGIKLPEVLFNTVDLVGDSTVPLSMIVVGMRLGSSNLKEVFGNKNLVLTSFIKMIFWPLLTFLAVNWIPMPVNMKVALVFGATFPSAVAVVPISSMEKRNSVLAAEGVALTTLLSVVTLPLVAIFLITYYGLA